jgi:UDP-glucuronate decarboxylase
VEGLVIPPPSSVARQTASDVVNEDLDYMRDRLADEFSAMAGKQLLITGGAGFLGYYLVQAVLHWNRSVQTERRIAITVFDNYMRGVPGWLGALAGDPQLTLVRHDITRPLPRNMPRFEYIIHAASIASPIYYRRFPIETMDANVGGLRRLLDHAVDRMAGPDPIEGFLFYSTSEIYGDPDPEHIPTSESYRGNVSCTGPRACYDESKRYGETLCVNFARVHEIPVTIARPFNNYGPGLKITDRRVIPDFARDILAERDIVMHSDGSPTRTYCYVADAVIGYFKVLVDGRAGEPYNIGVESPEISIRDLADRMVDLARATFGYTGRVVRQASNDAEYLTDNPNRRCPRINKAREKLGYDPGIELDDGLLRTLLWYRDHPSAEEA